MTRKDIYVFKAKFGVGNFEIEVYKLPVKKETAKAYFVDDHYTYRKKVLKEEIGITKELISEIMVVYLEENDFAKARSIFAAHNMERLEETKRKTPECSGVSFFRAGNSNSLTNAFHICVYVHLCVVPRYIASQHPWKQSQSLLQNTKETTAGHFRRSVFLLSGRIPGVHELLWKAASLSCGRYR